MAAAALTVDQAVEVTVEEGRVVIQPVRAPVFNLDDMLGRMAPETFPEEADFGPPVGGEVW